MPTYEYECRACGHSFERTQSMSEDPVKDCPECGKDVRRVINGGAGIIFKGSGFYVNDSKSKSSATTSSQKNNTQSGETAASDSSAANAGKKPAAESGTKPAGDSTAASAAAGSNAGARPEAKAGAKESA